MLTRRAAFNSALICAAVPFAEACSAAAGDGNDRSLEEFERPSETYATATLRRAFDWAARQKSATIRLPIRRTLLLDEEIQLPSRLSLIGDGSSTLRQVKPGLRALVADDVEDLFLEGFGVRGADIAALFEPERRLDKSGEAPRLVTDAGLVHVRSTRQGASRQIVFKHVDFGNAFNLLAVRGAIDVLIESCRFSDWLLCGALAPGCSQVRATGNLFQGCVQRRGYTAYAFSATGDAARGFPQHDLQFIRNIVRDVPSWDGFMTHEADGVTVEDNQFINVRNGIDVSSPRGAINGVSVRRNKIIHAASDPWGGSAASHFSIAVAADPSAPMIQTAVIEDNISIGANSVSGLTSGGFAIGALSLSRVQDLTVARNQFLRIGDMDSRLKSPKGYSAISLFDPGSRVTIEGNEGSGSLDRYFIEVHHARKRAETISITGNKFRSSRPMPSLVHFVSGDFQGVTLRGNTLTSSAAAPREYEIERSNTQIGFKIEPI
jgi:hypothetical protein